MSNQIPAKQYVVHINAQGGHPGVPIKQGITHMILSVTDDRGQQVIWRNAEMNAYTTLPHARRFLMKAIELIDKQIEADERMARP